MSRPEAWRGVPVFTVGHSTRSLDELLALLRAFDISVLADIRTIPRSRHNPQFNEDSLAAALRTGPIRYVHLGSLGGLRRARKDSINTGWRNASFRGFADYMQTDAFERGLDELGALTARGRIALLCAEAVPWRCHRSLVADALTVRGAHVEHILGLGHANPHHLTPFAKVEGTRVTYPGDDASGGRLSARGPFHLEATARVLQRRPENRVDLWEDDRYLRVLACEDRLVLVEVENRGTIDEPDVRFSVRAGELPAAARGDLDGTLRKVLGLEVDPGALQRLGSDVRALGPTALALRGMRPPRFPGWFEVFANVVPFQQLSLDAGLAIVSHLVERFGSRLEHDGHRYYAFPTAAAIAGARLPTLRECGLSARKAESLRHLARAIEAGELAEEKIAALGTDDALRALIELPGIGPWSAALVLLRGLGRLDVFPPGDVGAAHRLAKLLRLRSPASLDRVVDGLGDRRGYLYFCALGANLLARDLIHGAPPPPAPLQSSPRDRDRRAPGHASPRARA